MYYILLHPSILITVTVFLLIALYRIKTLFQIISTIYPILLLVLLFYSKGTYVATFNNINIRADFHEPYKLIAIASTIITFIANLYCLIKDRNIEIIICGIGLCSMQIGLFANDYISLYMSIEILMLVTSVMIFLGANNNNTSSARQYFLTHLFSSSLILMGFCFFMNETNSTEIVQLSNLTDSNNIKLLIFYYLLMFGCLINVAIFPFYTWMTDCYPKASSTGFIYIAAIFSKLPIIIIMKLFSTSEILKICGIVMILQGGLFSYLENNSKRVFCYLSITQYGLLILYISIGSTKILMSASIVLFWDILYKGLLALVLGITDDAVKTKNYERVELYPICSFSKTFMCAIAICFIFIANVPIISPIFLEKSLLNNSGLNQLTQFLIVASNILNIYAFINIYWKRAIDYSKIEVSRSTFYLLSFAIVVILSYMISWKYLAETILSFRGSIVVHYYMLYKQFIVIAFSISLFLILPRLQFITNWWNFDILTIICRVIGKLYYRSLSEMIRRWRLVQKKLNFLSLVNLNYKKTSIIYDQSLAISIIFIILIFFIIKHNKI